MPQGTPEHVPDDGLTTRQRRNRPLVIVHTGPGSYSVVSTSSSNLLPWLIAAIGVGIAILAVLAVLLWRRGRNRGGPHAVAG